MTLTYDPQSSPKHPYIPLVAWASSSISHLRPGRKDARERAGWIDCGTARTQPRTRAQLRAYYTMSALTPHGRVRKIAQRRRPSFARRLRDPSRVPDRERER